MHTTGFRIYWSIFEHGQWQLYIAKTEKGLCYIGSPGESFEKFRAYFKKRFPSASLEKSDGSLEGYKQEFAAYLNGSQEEFSLPIDVKGTSFQQQTWQALKEIPLWPNHHLFRNCRTDRQAFSRPGSGHRHRCKPIAHHCAMPPCHR